MDARDCAALALRRCRRDGAFSSDAPDSAVKKAGLSGRDAAFASAIFFGVQQNITLLDFYIDTWSAVKSKKLEPQVLDILRMSVYQIVFMDRVPNSAAVNTGVDMCKKDNARASGLVNAVLRHVSENAEKLPEPKGNGAEYLSVKYSHPLWIVREFIEDLGENGAREVLAANNSAAPLTLRVNTLKISRDKLIKMLASAEFSASPHPLGCDSILVDGGNVTGMPGFDEGLFFVQDAAASLAAAAAGPLACDSVLDVCAAPGGKSFSTAMLMNNAGRIVACDINKNKLSRIEAGAKRLGISIIETREMDAREPHAEFIEAFDTVLADLPCSGLGVIRKKPDIRFNKQSDVEALPQIQLELLCGAAHCVKPGGLLLYSTCTVRSSENSGVVGSFLSENEDFDREGFCLSDSGEITFWPHTDNTDGFYICRLRRKK